MRRLAASWTVALLLGWGSAEAAPLRSVVAFDLLGQCTAGEGPLGQTTWTNRTGQTIYIRAVQLEIWTGAHGDLGLWMDALGAPFVAALYTSRFSGAVLSPSKEIHFDPAWVEVPTGGALTFSYFCVHSPTPGAWVEYFAILRYTLTAP